MLLRSCCVLAMGMLCLTVAAQVHDVPAPAPTTQPAIARDLKAYREKFPTRLTQHGPPPAVWQDPTPLKLPAQAREVKFLSGDLKLGAWVSEVPQDGALHPAVVFCHGGFWFGNEDWDFIRPLLDAGFVVMMPRVRGENGNPGEFGYYASEVDDVIAAGRYLAGVKGVDPKRLFVSGHSAGGSLAVLACMKETPFALAAPIGAELDIRAAAKWKDERHKQLVVFDVNDLHELESRSAILFTASLRAPIVLFQGDKDGNAQPQKNFVALAHNFKKSARLVTVDGDHGQSLISAMPKLIELFKDYSPDRDIRLDLPAGWQQAVLPSKDTPKMSGKNEEFKAYFVLYARAKDQLREGMTIEEYANLVRKGAKATSDLTDRADTDVTTKTVDGKTIAWFDVTGKNNKEVLLHHRRFFVLTDHFFVELVGWTKAEDFDKALLQFDVLLSKVREGDRQ